MTHSRLLVPYLQMLEGCIQATNPQTFPSPMWPEYKARMEEKKIFFIFMVSLLHLFFFQGVPRYKQATVAYA